MALPTRSRSLLSQSGANYLGGLGQNFPWQEQQQGMQMNPLAQQGFGIGQSLPVAQNQSPILYGGNTPVIPTSGSNWLSKFSGMLGGNQASSAGTGGTLMGMGAQGWGNVLGAAQGIGALWLANNQLKQGKKEFKFNKGMAEANLANSAALINTNVKRRAESNAASLGLTGDKAKDYIENRKKEESVRGTI